MSLFTPKSPLDAPLPALRTGDSWFSIWGLAFSAMALGAAMQINDGLFEPHAFIGLTLAILGCVAIFIVQRRAWTERWGEPCAIWVVVAALVAEFIQHLCRTHPGGSEGPVASFEWRMVLATAVLLAAGVLFLPHLYRWAFLALLAVFVVMGLWIIRVSPQPHIDVWVAQTEGLKALMHGQNPYTITFADIYHGHGVYAPGTVENGRVHLGFPYPPLTVLLDLPSYLLTGDYRYSNLIEVALTALLIAYARPGRLAPLAALLFLFTPRVFLIIQHGFTEPSTAMCLAALVFCALRVPSLLGIMLGLFLVSKQYVLITAAPAILLLGPDFTFATLRRTFVQALLVGAVISVPLALWNPLAFVHSTVQVTAGAPFRRDALSYLSVLPNILGVEVPGTLAMLIGIGVAGLAAVLAVRRGPRTPAGYAAAVALMFFGFFGFNKFAFCNYYYLVVAALCCAIGAAAPSPAESTTHALTQEALAASH